MHCTRHRLLSNRHTGPVAQPANARSEITNTHTCTAVTRYKPRSALRTRMLRRRYSRLQQTLARKCQMRLCDQARVSRHNACQRKPCSRSCRRCTGRKTPCAGRSSAMGAWGSITCLQVIATGGQRTARHRAGRASRPLSGTGSSPGPVARRTPRKSANRLMQRHIVKELPTLADASLIYRQCRPGADR